MIPKRKIPTKKVTVLYSFGANLFPVYDNLRCTKIVPPHASRRPEERGNPRIVQTLVDASADGNIRSPSIHRGGNTAMDLAREGGYKEVEKKLGDKFAKNLVEKFGPEFVAELPPVRFQG